MYIPILRKIINSNNTLIERPLPEIGEITVQVGDKVEPFNQVGICKVSYNQIVLPKKFNPLNNLRFDKVSQGTTLGTHMGAYINAPFNGYLQKDSETGDWVYKETGRDFVLLSGVWGTVKSLINGKSVLIESFTKDFLLPVCSGTAHNGELIVFPNPSDLLIGSFLENFTKDTSGKIFYIGGHLSLAVIMKAKELNLTALLAGSISKDALKYAKKENISVGVFEGFGDISTSKIIFDELKNISNRMVFFDVENNLLRVPMPSKLDVTVVKKPIKLLKVGDTVQVFQYPNFGQIGTVDTIKESSILVKIPKNINLIEVSVPNFFVVL